MTDRYILNEDGEPEPCPDLLTWARWFERASRDRSRILAHDRDEGGGVDVLISTVFLGLDHSWSGHGPPILWETLVMGGPLDGEGGRYRSRDDALRGHQAICARVREAILNLSH